MIENENASPEAPPTPPSQCEPPRHVPKIVPGQLAVCGYCGYVSEDFSKCLRCKRVLPEGVKAVQAKVQLSANKFEGKVQNSPGKKKKAELDEEKEKKGRLFENETVVLSSDDEEEEKKQDRLPNAQIIQKLGDAITLSLITKEPSLREIQQHKIRGKLAVTCDV